MVGRPSKKIQCQARRKYDGNQCQAKGILKNNGRYLCRLHGGLSYGQKTIEGRARALMNLKQNKEKNYEEIKRSIEINY
tara:strand:- start:966 stop:1202 length:237 start_codon:yes stop_codon:yes gene_type:complete